MAALKALEGATRVDVLVTRVRYPEGKPNGVSLALVTRTKRPGLRVLFAGGEEDEKYTEGVGEFMPLPVDMPRLIETVSRLVQESRRSPI